jgi:branched-chain amino acid transport system ATP-binding protein
MLLEVKELKVHYGGVEVVGGVFLEVDEDTIVTIIGANGAGKTTILRTISGLKQATSGEIYFQGVRIDRTEPHEIVKMGISQIPEGRRLFPYLTVENNLLLGSYVRKDRKEVSEDLDEIYELFPVLLERRKSRAANLSGGEQQMLAIGRALLSKPRLLLMDEPSLGLAPWLVKEMKNIIKRISERGVSIVLVEQNAQMALKIADFAYVLETGAITLKGKASELAQDIRVKEAYLGG